MNIKMLLNRRGLNLYIGILLLISSFLIFAPVFKTAHAQPDTFCQKNESNATSSPHYMTSGFGTTTITVNTCASDVYGVKSGVLLMQFTASSSVTSTYQMNQEFSQDGIDWYEGTQFVVVPLSTTTPVTAGYDLAPIPLYTFLFASSTLGQSAVPSATNNRATRILPFSTPTQYTRFVFYMKTNSAGGAIWAVPIMKKEIGER